MDAWLYDTLTERLDSEQFSRIRGRGDAVQSGLQRPEEWEGLSYEETTDGVRSVSTLNFYALFARRWIGVRRPGKSQRSADRLDTLETVSVIRTYWLTAAPSTGPVIGVVLPFWALFLSRTSIRGGRDAGCRTPSHRVQVPAGVPTAAARVGEAGATLALGLGAMYASLTAVSSVAATTPAQLRTASASAVPWLSYRALTAIALIAPLWVALALPTFASMRTAMPLVQPIANGYINDHIDGVGRATLLSAVSMFYMTLRTPLALSAGIVADATTATVAMAALGGLFLVVGGAVWIFGDVVPETEATVGTGTADSLA